MQPELSDLILIGAVVLLAKLLDLKRERERSPLSRHSAAIAKETAGEARAVAKEHEQALKRALKEVR